MPTIFVQAQFSAPAEASEACTHLNGGQAFGATITARLPSGNTVLNKSVFKGTAVRIRWKAPSKIGFCGYSMMEQALKAMEAARVLLKDDANIGDMERFNHPEDVIWSQPNYQNLDMGINGIKRLLAADSSDSLRGSRTEYLAASVSQRRHCHRTTLLYSALRLPATVSMAESRYARGKRRV
jgi:hypothetical protein